MKTIEVNIYKFSELSEDAKAKAINHFRDNSKDDFGYIWGDARGSLDKFCDLFNINWSQIDPCEPYRNEYRINLDSEVLSLYGFRLAAKLWTNYKSDLFKGKYYSVSSGKKVYHKRVKSKEYKNGKIFNAYYSAITLDNCCVLTGACYDDSLLKPIYDFMNAPRKNVSFEDLLNECIHSLCHDIASEIEYQTSDEGITEMIEANEYDFTEDGKLY